LNEFKVYNDVSWDGPSLDCNGCHRNNPQTAYPTVEASVGNSHAWISDWGYEDLHSWVHGFDPLFCRVCHYNTTTEPMTWTRDAMDITYYDDVPIANKSYHVNGAKDVAFDPINPVTFNSTFDVSGIVWDPVDKVCAGTPCHLEQQNPQWGWPYRAGWGSMECNVCHQYDAGGGRERGKQATQTIPEHAAIGEKTCLECHSEHDRIGQR
jgi:hypothetical protein